MGQLQTERGSVVYDVLGAGPPVLVPACNYAWADIPYFDALAEHHSVILASPSGFQGSSRLSAPTYRLEAMLRDLLEVCDTLGVERFAVFGYSLSAAVAGALAGQTERVCAAILGGFPLLGEYGRVRDRAEVDAVALAEQLDGTAFDIAAALAVYRDLAAKPAGALVHDLRCPLLAYWGGADTVLRSFGTDPLDDSALRGLGASVQILPGLDHADVLLAHDQVIPGAIAWLAAQ